MTNNPNSILDSVKKVIGFDSDYEEFDLDVILFINSALGSLQQLGVGSSTGFMITDNTTLWSQYIPNLGMLGMVKSFISLSAKMAFDPPTLSFVIEAYQKQLEELTFRINVAAEHDSPPSDPFSGESVEEGFVPKVVQLDFASTITPDAFAGNMFYLTMTGDCTINAPVNGEDGEHITLDVTSNGHSVTWGNGWNFGTLGEPVLSSGGKEDVISAFYRQSATEWRAGYAPGF